MVDGALTGTVAIPYGPGHAIQFVATFTGDPWQHIGFGIDYSAAPWIIFSTFQVVSSMPGRAPRLGKQSIR